MKIITPTNKSTLTDSSVDFYVDFPNAVGDIKVSCRQYNKSPSLIFNKINHGSFTVPVSQNFSFEVDYVYHGNGDYLSLHGNDSLPNRIYIGLFASDRCFISAIGIYWKKTSTAKVVIGQRLKQKVEYSDGEMRIYKNGILVDSMSGVSPSVVPVDMALGGAVQPSGVVFRGKSTIFSMQYIDNDDPANSITYILDSGNIDREASEEYPDNTTKDLIYTNVIKSDWAYPSQ